MKKTNSCRLALFSLVPLCIGAESYLGGIPTHPARVKPDTTLLISQPSPSEPAPAPFAPLALQSAQLHPTRDHGDIAYDSTWEILPREEVWEVGASKLDTQLIRHLPGSGFQALSKNNAGFLAGRHYSCPANLHPYLIRAVYRKGGTGQFRAERKGNKLAIVWADPTFIHPEEPDRPRQYEESAVIVNLDFTPDEVFTETTFAL
jgi:hypothetical protein